MTSSISVPEESLPAGAFPELVLDLIDIHPDMLPLAGGKAVNLGEMLRAGLPVPGGICVTTEAYGKVASGAAIDFGALNEAPASQVESLASRARQAILSAPLPRFIETAITSGYAALGDDVPVAVRSSATAEDLPNASFAGQQDTYLHVVGAGAVVDAVRRCWASLWTERAVVYRATNQIDHRAVRIAVVVQRMIESRIAGVLFTANPVTGRRRQAVLDANPGLGEAVVSGAVNPDHFVVNTGTGEIVERRIGEKSIEIRSLAGGGTETIARTGGASQACIDDCQVRALAQMGERVEQHFGRPQDTEWAIDDSGKIWLTQARPITTLFPLPAGAPGDRLNVYFCFSVAQGLYRPLTPMGLAAIRCMASAAARELGIPVQDPLDGPPIYREAAQRVFLDLTAVMRGRVGRAIMLRVFDTMESRSAQLLRTLKDEPGLSIKKRTPFLLMKRVARLAARHGMPAQVIRALFRPAASRERARRIGQELNARLAICPRASATQRLEFVEKILIGDVVPLVPRILPACVTGFGLLGLAMKLLGRDAQPGDLETVLRGLPYNVTTEMDLELWRLSRQIGENREHAQLVLATPAAELARRYHQFALPPAIERGVSAFLAKYGHRAVAEIDIGMPRWSDDPAHIFGVLANYLRVEDPELAPDVQFERAAKAAESMIETLVGRARRRGWWRAKIVGPALRRTRELAGLRELPKYYAIVTLAAARRELAKVGGELVRQGALDSPDDIFFLDLKEAKAALRGGEVRQLVAARRETYELELRRRHVPNVLLSDGTEPQLPRAAVRDDQMAGTPASAGSVTGIARVIDDPVGAHLEPGEILVAPSTDPGWTPLFLTAGGLVMEMGGANSHGAVVAREYGIPAVVGVPKATGRILTGQRITVDGTQGVITLLEEAGGGAA